MVKILRGLLLASALLLGCQPDPQEGEPAGPRPGIRALLTQADTVGALVRLTTINGSPTAAENTVFFNQRPATAVAVRGDTLLVGVPVGATTGKLTLQVHGQRSGSELRFTVLRGRWRRRADTPSARLGPVVVSGGNGAYWGLGELQPPGFRFPQRDLWRYDPATNGWARQADMPGPLRSNAFAFSLGSQVYVGMGRNSSNNAFLVRDFYAFSPYTPSTDTWSLQAALPQPRRALMAFVVGNKAYAGINFTQDVYEYDPAANTWTLKTRFPGAGSYYTQGFSLPGKGYVVGGVRNDVLEGNDISAELWEFIP